jgi:hypothetical protein
MRSQPQKKIRGLEEIGLWKDGERGLFDQFEDFTPEYNI